MNKKSIIIIIILSGLIFLAFLALVFVLLNTDSSNPDSTIEIQGQEEKVVTNNFVVESPTYQGETILFSDSDINIEYDAASSYFQITFTSIDPEFLYSNRTKAETILLEKLNIDPADACKLKVTEILPPADPSLSSPKYYPLSFCAGGDRFP